MTSIEYAKQTLINNDLGGYTVPTHGLYPFQWNWDSAIVALGWLTFDEKRAWLEIESLISAQWENGMIPHVVFHQHSSTYFPGPDVWGAKRQPDSTSISQPPVLASVASKLYQEGKDRALAREHLSHSIDALIDYHLWWYNERDPEQTGLVVNYHPWETGMDNSPSWDKALAEVPQVNWEYTRRDTNHIDAAQRPHKSEYDRFLYLVDFYKAQGFDSATIYAKCPYKMIDIGIVSILHRANNDLLQLCEELGINDERVNYLAKRGEKTASAITTLYNGETGMFHSKNLLTGKLAEARVTGGLLPIFAGLGTPEMLSSLVTTIDKWIDASGFALASTHPHDPCYEPQRYWRGPVWLHINWMIAEGLSCSGHNDLAEKIRQSSQALINTSGYNESFHAETGERSGGSDFSWTAAMALYWLY